MPKWWEGQRERERISDRVPPEHGVHGRALSQDP